LQAFCAEHLAAFKVPRQIRIVQALPRNAMGKILKSELRKTASDEVSE
jgi:acyl-coenzyme A synthetase/AMP-(fatty) acid ligase